MTSLASWLTGKLSTSERIVTAVAPAVLLVVFVIGALGVYVARNLVRGHFHDEEMDHRGLGGLIGARVRHFFAWLVRPFWRGLAAAQVPPNAITTLSLGLAIAAGVAVAAGRFALGGWLFVGAGVLDFFDGRVARETGRATPGGAALDSVLDRYVESALLVGLAWYYRDTWALLPALLALTGSLFVPYVRARGEALGATMKDVGFMQRPERILVLGLTVALAPVPEALLVPHDPTPPHRLAIAGLVLVAFTSHATAIQRLSHLVRSLDRAARPDLRPLPKMIVASVVATNADFAMVAALVEGASASPSIATVIGCVVGGTIAFSLSRVWAFEATGEPAGRQAFRYVFVSGTSALLNGGGVAVLLLLPDVPYQLAWVVARAVVFATWNFPLTRDWVFPSSRPSDHELEPVPSVRGS
jgi:phosphatidylglycerophosphate synthase/putative flippase GtrA